MSSLVQIFGETSAAAEQPRAIPRGQDSPCLTVSRRTAIHEEQLQSLVQQLFFRPGTGPPRHIGFAAADDATATAPLCFDVASMLLEEGGCDIGLIDASPDSLPLQAQLDIAPPATPDSAWLIAPRLWLVPRQSWLPGGTGSRTTEQNLARLRELTAEFDFSVLCCSHVSWATTKIGRACDGLVLVLTANKTRRLAAVQMRDQLRKAHVPLLGTVLAGRRFPIPRGLYRSL